MIRMRPRTRGEARPARQRTAPPKTCDDTINRFLNHHRTRRRSDLTIRGYQNDFAAFAKWFEDYRREGSSLNAIDAEVMLDFQEHLASRLIATRDPATEKVTTGRPKAATVN